MRRFFLTLWVVILTLLPMTVEAGYLGIHKASENIVFNLLTPLDSDGLPGKPDSAHVECWRDDLDTACYHVQNTTFPFSAIGIDTAKNAKDTSYVFRDQIQDIDGVAGNFGLSIVVRLYTDGIKTETFGYVQVVMDSLNKGLFTVDTAGIAQDVYAEFIDGSNEDEFKSDGDTIQRNAAATTVCDSVNAAISDANKPNFHSDGDTINRAASVLVATDNIGIQAEDVEGSFNANDFELSYYNALAYFFWNYEPERAITGKVTLVDSSAAGIHDAEVAALANGTAIAALNDFDSESDLVKVKEIKANTLGDTTLQDNATEYSDTNTDPFDADVDSVINDISVGITSGWMMKQADFSRAYVWNDILNPDGKYITNSYEAIAPALDGATGSFDAADFETAYYDTVTATIRLRIDTLFTLIDSLNKVLDSIYLANYNATSDCEGVGIYTCTLYVTDTLNDWRVPWVNVSINSQAEDIPPRTVTTDVNGRIIVQYSDGLYRAACLNVMLRNNEGGSPFLDFEVDGAPLLDSLMGYLQSVGTPSSAEICSVYGWMYDVQSSPVAGATIIFELISDQDTLYYDNVMYLRGRTITESNSDGYWSIGVVPNELLDTLSHYSVDIIRGHRRAPIESHFDVYVPDSATVNLDDLLINFNRKGK